MGRDRPTYDRQLRAGVRVSTVIGIDARAAAEVPAGRGRFVREFLQALAERDDQHRYVLYAREAWEEAIFDERFSWRLVAARDPVWNLRVGRLVTHECDVFFSINSYLTAWFSLASTALNVFDLIAWEAPREAQRGAALVERATIGLALRRAALIFCNAESTRRELARRWPSASDRVVSLPLAASPVFARSQSPEALDEIRHRHGLMKPFVLAVGTLEPRKNLLRLMDAFSGLRPDLRDSHVLAIAGPRGWEFGPILARAEQSAGIVVLGKISDEELAAMYQLCTVFCYPSLYEGFGLPVLEAMSAGAAVVTSNVSSLPEVAGSAALYADPRDTVAIRDAITCLLDSPSEREELGRRARERASEFSWDKTAERALAHLVGLARTRS
jgi:glycosyltransferase involved in cell wall biosynthesis